MNALHSGEDRVSFVRSWWEKRGPTVQDSPDYIHAVRAWREAFRPKRVRVLLVAESHVGQAPEDAGVRVRVPEDALVHPLKLPDRFVRLVYCIGYGCDSICTPCPRKNSGTPQFWNIFKELAAGHPLVTDTATPGAVARHVRVLEALRDRGVWLVDASVIALYHPSGVRLFNSRMCHEIIRSSFEAFVWPDVKDDKPEQVWVIGKGVGKALAGCKGISPDNVISQPGDRNRATYLAGLQALLRSVRPKD